jgi:CRP-like cAMP-binding protein
MNSIRSKAICLQERYPGVNLPPGIRIKTYKNKTILHSAEDLAPNLSLLIDGSVMTFEDLPDGPRRAIGLFRPLSLLGERTRVSDDYAHPAHAVTLKLSKVLSVPRDLFPDVVMNYEGLARDIYNGLDRDTGYLHDRNSKRN